MMFHKYTDDQKEVIASVQAGRYKMLNPSTRSGYTFMTASGIEFDWLLGLGDGKTVRIEKQVQPEWFARKIRKIIDL